MSSTGSREAKARVTLDKAEKIIIEKFTKFNLSEKQQRQFKKIFAKYGIVQVAVIVSLKILQIYQKKF